MVRPKAKEPKQQYTVMLKPSVVKEIDELAEKIGITRSQFIGNLIDFGLEEAKAIDRWGLIKIGVATRDIYDKFREKVTNGKVSLDKEGNLKIKE